MARTKSKQKDSTRQALINAVQTLVMEQGNTEFSLARVTEVSGKNAALVSYHFGGKEGLLLAALEDDWESMTEQLERLKSLDLPADEKLRLHVHRMVSLHCERPYFGIMTRVILRRSSAKAAERLVEKLIMPVVDFQADLLKQGVRSGQFREIDPLTFYAMSVGSVEMYFNSASSTWLAFDRKVDDELPEDFARNLADMLLAAVLRKP